jgi:hypothetical protein
MRNLVTGLAGAPVGRHTNSHYTAGRLRFRIRRMPPDKQDRAAPVGGKPSSKSSRPLTRAKRVRDLRDRVQNGTYDVDSKELAKALIKHHTVAGKS